MQRAMQIILLGLSVWFTAAVLVVVGFHNLKRWVQRRSQNKKQGYA
jgi:hypothetical protein